MTVDLGVMAVTAGCSSTTQLFPVALRRRVAEQNSHAGSGRSSSRTHCLGPTPLEVGCEREGFES